MPAKNVSKQEVTPIIRPYVFIIEKLSELLVVFFLFFHLHFLLLLLHCRNWIITYFYAIIVGTAATAVVVFV